MCRSDPFIFVGGVYSFLSSLEISSGVSSDVGMPLGFQALFPAAAFLAGRFVLTFFFGILAPPFYSFY